VRVVFGIQRQGQFYVVLYKKTQMASGIKDLLEFLNPFTKVKREERNIRRIAHLLEKAKSKEEKEQIAKAALKTKFVSDRHRRIVCTELQKHIPEESPLRKEIKQLRIA
jgi:hypothetical protein